jgi:WD40 repeat protein
MERGILAGLAASPDGRLVAVGSQDGLVVLYDAQTMERKRVLYGHMQGVHGVKFSPDGKSLVSGSTGREAVKLWHVETGQELLTLAGRGSLLNHVEFIDHGNALLAGGRGQQGTWQIWRAPSWEEIAAAEAKAKTETKLP